MQEMIAHIITGGNETTRALATREFLKDWGIQPENTIRILKNEEKLSIGVEEIRETLSHLYLLPPGKTNQCLLVPEAQSLTPEAMNALLKTIEEPPARTHILLSTENTDTLLPTILSRCRIVSLKTESYTVSEETKNIHSEALAVLTKGTRKEKLIYLKKYLKRDDALIWIDSLLPYVDSLLLSENDNHHTGQSLKDYARVASKLLHARDLLQRNISPTLVIDDIALSP